MSAQAIPTTVQNPVVLNLSASYGALIIAAYISAALWGINVMQTYIYYWSYPDDVFAVKSLVAFLLYGLLHSLPETASSPGSTVAGSLTQLIRYLLPRPHGLPWFKIGDVSRQSLTLHKALHEAWVGSIIVVVVQLYFLRRIAKFASTTSHARSWWLWIIFIALVGLSISQVPYCVFAINRVNIFISLNLRIKRASLIAATIVDLVIAGTMIMLLKDTESADGSTYRSKRTSRTIRRLTVITINTGLITAVVAILSLILDETASGTVFWTAIAQYPQCSIYLSAFLANLNARSYIRGGGDGATFNIEDIRFASASAAGNAEAGHISEQHVVLRQLGSVAYSSRTEGQQTTNPSVPEKFSH
ncbi:NAD-P-binding protein [Mycena sanguinolenta]|uniref:NAD-P-binding protein n=1 Tax=Mycena sanguinolenta TaxID=230812 RepID=A0A8H6Y9E7_9AGAR|nr:NAD-P-binding protein [Mycena sanguinolenta]